MVTTHNRTTGYEFDQIKGEILKMANSIARPEICLS